MVFRPFVRGGSRRSAGWPARPLRRLAYYGRSIPRLMVGLDRPWRTVLVFLGLWKRPGRIVVRRTGLELEVRDRMDVWIVKEVLLDDAYFPPWVSAAPGWRVVDIGGGIGEFAVLAALRSPRGIVHVYEPSREAHAFLVKNVAINGVDNIVIYPCAVSDRARRMAPARGGRPGAPSTRFVETADGVVEAVSLASVLDALPGGECDFMKIDCEGCELEILLGSDPALLERIHRISVEFHGGPTGPRRSDLAERLVASGFRVWERDDPVHAHMGQIYAENVRTSGEDASDEARSG